jgi:integrase/recombinase XerD
VKFLFRVTLRRLDLVAEFYRVRQPITIPPVLSADEVEPLLTAANSLRVRVMLSLSYGCGLRAGEVIRLRAGDIDSAQNIIRIMQSKGRKDRLVMLPPCVLALSRQWWLERPTDQDAAWRPGIAGCFRAACRASRSRRGSSTGCSTRRPGRRASANG